LDLLIGGYMILVTLGTQDKEFTRLLKEIDRLIDNKIINDKVIVQAGYTKYKSKNMLIFDYLPKKELEEYMKEANFIITHAGVGSVFDALKKDKKVIAVARLSKYKEHNNDHQLELLEEFSKEKLIIPVVEMDELEPAIKKIDSFIPNKYESNNQKMVDLVSNYIDNNEAKGLVKLLNKYREVIMYLIFGVLTTLVSVVTRLILFHTICNADKALDVQVATIISNAVGIAFAYVTNRKYVFESTNKNKLKEALSFVGGRLSTLGMDMLIMFVGVTVLKGNETVITLISQVIVIVANYLISKLFVFKKR